MELKVERNVTVLFLIYSFFHSTIKEMVEQRCVKLVELQALISSKLIQSNSF